MALSVLAGLAVASPAAASTTWHVSGVNCNTGSATNTTLRYSLSHAASGDTIVFDSLSGTFTCTAQLPNVPGGVHLDGNSSITISGASAGGSSDGLFVSGSGATIDDLTIAGFGNSGVHLRGGTNATVRNVTITGSGGPGILVEGGSTGSSGQFLYANTVGASGGGKRQLQHLERRVRRDHGPP